MTQTSQINKNNRTIMVIVVVGALIIAGVVWAIITYGPALNNNQSQDTYVPNLTTDLQLSDNRTNAHAPFLQVMGTIQNTGNGTANNVIMHVYAIQSGNATAIDKSQALASIEAGQTQTVDLTFSYTGEALVAYYDPTLDWTN